MLSVQHVTKRFGGFTALDNINLTFEQGVYGLLAPNGAGKTTLIRMLATLAFPTSGQILWDGEDIYALGEAYRALVGYLPQDFGFYPGYTARRFLRYVAALQRLPRARTEARIEEVLGLAGLAEAGDRKLKTFSGGMIQRVGIATALFADPRILILDEPTAGLDPRERARFRTLIHQLARNRIVILSTHIVSDVEAIAGTVILLKDHGVLQAAPPRAICAPLAGRVFECPGDVTASDAADQAGVLVLSEREGISGSVRRVLAAATPPAGEPVEPTLEDAFLTIYGAA